MKRSSLLFLFVFLSALSFGQRNYGILSFDGVDDYALSGVDNQRDLTLEAYFRTCSPGGALTAIPLWGGLDTHVVTGYELRLSTNSSGNVGSLTLITGDQSTFSSDTFALPFYSHDNWHHVAMSYDFSRKKHVVFFDGDSLGFSFGGEPNYNNNLFIGTDLDRQDFFQGQFTEYKRSYSLLYKHGYPLPTTSPTDSSNHFWDFDTYTGTLFLSRKGDSLITVNGLKNFALVGGNLSEDTLRDEACGLDTAVYFNTFWEYGGLGEFDDSSGLSFSGLAVQMASDQERFLTMTYTDTNQCENSFVFHLDPWFPPVVDLGPDTSICEGDTIVLDIGHRDSSLGIYWNFGWGGFTYPVSEAGLVIAEYGRFQCLSVDSIQVSIQAAPQPYIGEDTILPEGYTIVLATQQAWSSYLWSNFQTDSSILATKPGTYWVEVTDTNGCTGADSVWVGIEGSFPFGIRDKREESMEVFVFPNPVKDKVFIQGAENPAYRLYDVSGKLLQEGEGNELKLPRPTGLYFLEVEKDGLQQRLKILRSSP